MTDEVLRGCVMLFDLQRLQMFQTSCDHHIEVNTEKRLLLNLYGLKIKIQQIIDNVQKFMETHETFERKELQTIKEVDISNHTVQELEDLIDQCTYFKAWFYPFDTEEFSRLDRMSQRLEEKKSKLMNAEPFDTTRARIEEIDFKIKESSFVFQTDLNYFSKRIAELFNGIIIGNIRQISGLPSEVPPLHRVIHEPPSSHSLNEQLTVFPLNFTQPRVFSIGLGAEEIIRSSHIHW